MILKLDPYFLISINNLCSCWSLEELQQNFSYKSDHFGFFFHLTGRLDSKGKEKISPGSLRSLPDFFSKRLEQAAFTVAAS